MYKTAVRSARLCELEPMPLTKKQEAEVEEVEFKILTFSMGVTWMDKIKS